MKFSTKLTLLFSSIVLIISFSLIYFPYISNTKIMEMRIQDRLQNQAFQTMDELDRMLFERYVDIKQLSYDSVLRSRDSTTKEITERLKKLQDLNKGYRSLSFFDMNRVRIADTAGVNIGKRHELTTFWREIAREKDFDMSFYRSESFKINICHFMCVVRDKKGSPVGVLVTRIDENALSDIVNKERINDEIQETIMIDLVDKDGIIIYSNHNKEGVLRDVDRDWKLLQKERKAEKLGSIKQTDPADSYGEEILVFAKEQGHLDYKGNNWTLLMSIPTSVAFAPLKELRDKTIIFSLIACSLALIIVYLASRNISQKIERLGLVATEIGRGNLDVDLDISSKDEIGLLSRTLLQMSDSLKEKRAKLLEYTDSLEAEVAKRTESYKSAKEAAEEAAKIKDKFVNLVSHDLKAPLSVVRSYLEILKDCDHNLEEVVKNVTREAIEDCDRMIRLINNILDLKRIKDGKLTPKLGFIEARKIVEEALSGFKGIASSKGINISNQIPEGTTIHADKELIYMVLTNLIHNAIKYSKAGGAVRLFVPDGEDYSTLAIADNGIGIEKDRLGSLFKYEEKTSTFGTGGESGTGFGLPLSYDIVKAHGGDLTIVTEEGKGSTFYVRLPQTRPGNRIKY